MPPPPLMLRSYDGTEMCILLLIAYCLFALFYYYGICEVISVPSISEWGQFSIVYKKNTMSVLIAFLLAIIV